MHVCEYVTYLLVREAEVEKRRPEKTWPMTSPNPLVTAANAAKLETLSYKALGLTPPSKLKGAADVEYSPNIEPTPPTSEAVPVK